MAFGGGLGGMARFWLSNRIAERLGNGFPWGTLVVNVCGCALIGVLAAWLGAGAGDAAGRPTLWAGLAIGLIGSFTTVSSFSLQTMDLWLAGYKGRALANVIASLCSCLGAAAGAHALARLVMS